MDKGHKIISVIIPSRNRTEFTIEAVQSVLDQRLANFFSTEIIVIDDGSDIPLNTALEKEFGSKVKVIRNKQSNGPGGARNVGLKIARGDYIAFLDCDDKWKNNFLTESIKILKRKRTVATVCLTKPYFFGNFPFYNKTKLTILNIVKYVFLTVSYIFNKGFLPKSAFYLCQISHQLFDAGIVKKLRFNEKTAAAEDWEFVVGATMDKNVAIVLSPLVDFRYEIKSNTFSAQVKAEKEKAYLDLLLNIPNSHKKFPFYWLFKSYIKYFLVK